MKSDANQQGRLQIIVSSKSELCQLAQRLRFEKGKDLVVRVVRGIKMRSAPQLFDEFSAAFQFPAYFGENWDAFEECLNDLEWLPARGYVLLVSEAAEVLSQQQYRQFEIFVDILFKACEKWGATEPTKQFHVFFQCTSSDMDSLRLRFHAARVPVSVGRADLCK